jgi:hypothetical protein
VRVTFITATASSLVYVHRAQVETIGQVPVALAVVEPQVVLVGPQG